MRIWMLHVCAVLDPTQVQNWIPAHPCLPLEEQGWGKAGETHDWKMRPKQRNIPWNPSLSPPSSPQRCDDNIAELLLALTAVGRQPRRRDGPRLCRSTVHPLWCLITQKMWKQGQWTGNATERSRASENNGKERKKQTESSWGGGCSDRELRQT